MTLSMVQSAWVVGGASGDALDVLIGEKVRQLRTGRRWRPVDLAVAAGWTHAAVLALEAGHTRLTIRDAAALCRALQVPLSALLEGAETEALALGLPTRGAA
jgi:transcriptional regulator with XRE-family HTH domain